MGRGGRIDIAALNRDLDESRNYDSHQCYQYLEPTQRDGHTLQSFGNSDLADRTTDTLVEWNFVDGILGTIGVQPLKNTFEEVRNDFKARIGVEPKESMVPMRNTYGATWSNPNADWLTPDVHAHLSNDENPAKSGGGPWLLVETRAAYDEKVRKMKSQPNPLD